jgi:hypothetical protein
MAITLSNHLKATLYTDDIRSLDERKFRIPYDRCFTVLHFSYECRRERNKLGYPFGDTTSTILSFTVRLMSPEDGKPFYHQMQQNEPEFFTFLFNVTLFNRQAVTGYEDAMIVNGYVIDVDDDFTNAPTSEGDTEQMLIHVKLLVANITYVGLNGNRSIEISRK